MLTFYSCTHNGSCDSIFLKQDPNALDVLPDYLLIYPAINQEIIYIGSLIDDSEKTKIHYFFRAANNNSTAQLWQQREKTNPAQPMNVPIHYPINIVNNKLFFLAPDGVVKALDVFEKCYTFSITTDWINAHVNNWQSAIPLYLKMFPPLTSAIPIAGMANRRGQPLKSWYNTESQQFVFILAQNNTQPSYLGDVNTNHYFFDEEAKTLFRQAKQTLHLNGTQIQSLPESEEIATSLEKVYLFKQTIWLHTQEGQLYLFTPENNTFWLRKIYPASFLKRPICLPPYFAINYDSRIKCFHPVDRFVLLPTYQLDYSELIFIEEKINKTTGFWDPKSKVFYSTPLNKDGTHWQYIETNSLEGSIYLFNAFEQLIYQIWPNGHHRNFTMIPTTLALRNQNLALLIINGRERLPLPTYFIESPSFELPLLKNVKSLTLVVSIDKLFKFIINPELLMQYQFITYQLKVNNTRNSLSFLEESNFLASRRGQDIIITSTKYPCQIVLMNAMDDTAFQYTTLKMIDWKHGVEHLQTLAKIRDELTTIPAANETRFFMPIMPDWWLKNSSTRLTSQPTSRLPLARQPMEQQSKLATQTTPVLGTTNSMLATIASIGGSIVLVTTFLFARRYQRANRYRQLAQTVTPATKAAAVAIPLLEIPRAEASSLNGIYHYSTKDFFAANECVQTKQGLIGLCKNAKETAIWWRNGNEVNACIYQLNKKSIINNVLLSETENRLYLLIQRDHAATQQLNLSELHSINLEAIYPYLQAVYAYLPENQQVRLRTILQHEIAYTQFYQSAQQISLRYLGNHWLLHTRLGDSFQALGLQLDWLRRDDSHWLARCLFTAQQLAYNQHSISLYTNNAAALFLETVLLHPTIQHYYQQYLPKVDLWKGKQVLRLLADILQFGFNAWHLLPNILVFLFPNYPSIYTISYGLSMALHLAEQDIHYWYLSVALFVLPHVPALLEYMGIPVTRATNQMINSLSQWLISLGLLAAIEVQPDQERLEEQKNETLRSENRLKVANTWQKKLSANLFTFFSRQETAVNDDVIYNNIKKTI